MDIMIVFLIAIMVTGGVLVFRVLPLWRRDERDDRPMQLAELMEREGLSAANAVASGDAHDLARATARCGMCTGEAECRAWLDSGKHEGYQAFCPNAELIERLKRR